MLLQGHPIPINEEPRDLGNAPATFNLVSSHDEHAVAELVPEVAVLYRLLIRSR